MTCEKKELDVTTAVATAANRLDEAGKTGPGSARHVAAMKEFLECLHRPGALEALPTVVRPALSVDKH